MVRTLLLSSVILSCALFFGVVNASAVGPGKELVWPGGGQGEVRFEGSEHAEEGHGCKDCHSGLFSMKFGTARMTMAELNSGRFCGACHNGATAFSTKDPKECHECHRQKKHRDREHHEKRDERDHDD